MSQNIAALMLQQMSQSQVKTEDYKWTDELKPIIARFVDELKIVELILKQNKATLA